MSEDFENPTDEHEQENHDGEVVTESTPRRTQLIIGAGVLAVLLVVGVGILLSRSSGSSSQASTVTTKTKVCGGGSWPANFLGKPARMEKAAAPSVYAWSDGTGFHIRAIDTTGETPISGQVTTSNGVFGESIKKSPADAAVDYHFEKGVLSFSFTANKVLAGLDFSLCSSTQASISVKSGDALWPLERFFLGSQGRAVSNPVLLSRS